MFMQNLGGQAKSIMAFSASANSEIKKECPMKMGFESCYKSHVN